MTSEEVEQLQLLKKVIFSDESQFVLSTNKRVYITFFLSGKISFMIWGCICYDVVGTMTAVEANVNSARYSYILDRNLSPVVLFPPPPLHF